MAEELHERVIYLCVCVWVWQKRFMNTYGVAWADHLDQCKKANEVMTNYDARLTTDTHSTQKLGHGRLRYSIAD